MLFSGVMATMGRLQNRCNDMEHLHCLSIINMASSRLKAKGYASRGIHIVLGRISSRW